MGPEIVHRNIECCIAALQLAHGFVRISLVFQVSYALSALAR